MKYEVTIKGTLPTALNNSNSDDCINLACDCTAAIIMLYANSSYQSVEAIYQSVQARYVCDGYFTITIRKTITRREPPIVGEMEDNERCTLERELGLALYSLPFSTESRLENPIITKVTPLL